MFWFPIYSTNNHQYHFLYVLHVLGKFDLALCIDPLFAIIDFRMYESEEHEDQLQGKVIQNYEILEVIGSGTFGKVYKVRHVEKEAVFAMKHVFQNKKYKNRELDVLKELSSNYSVRLHDHFYKEEQDKMYLNLVMEYLPSTLSRAIKDNYLQKEFMAPELIKRYAMCLLSGLKDMHYANICHRDIKPSNILIDEENSKFCDFGSAKVLSVGHKNISYICSRYYRAPELLLGAVYYSTQVDIWSLGCVIAEMLMNRALFEGSNANGMFTKIIRCIGSPSLEDLKSMMVDDEEIAEMKMEGSGLKNRILRYNPNSPGQLVDLVSRMIVFNPDRRITAAQALNLPLFK